MRLRREWDCMFNWYAHKTGNPAVPSGTAWRSCSNNSKRQANMCWSRCGIMGRERQLQRAPTETVFQM